MRLIVFFDLPIQTYKNQKEYRRFRKLLINEGFLMMQESVYAKLAINMSVIESVRLKLEKEKPKEGLIQMLVITEKQFSRIDTIIGNVTSEEIDSTERLIIL